MTVLGNEGEIFSKIQSSQKISMELNEFIKSFQILIIIVSVVVGFQLIQLSSSPLPTSIPIGSKNLLDHP